MSTLKSILIKYADLTHDAGETETRIQDTHDYEMLKTELLATKNQKNSLLWIFIIMVIMVFALELILILMYLKNPGTISVIFSSGGITIGGLITLMRKTWLEKAKIDLIYKLSVNLTPENVGMIVNTIAARL